MRFTKAEVEAMSKKFEGVVHSDTHPLFPLWEMLDILKEDGEITITIRDAADAADNARAAVNAADAADNARAAVNAE